MSHISVNIRPTEPSIFNLNVASSHKLSSIPSSNHSSLLTPIETFLSAYDYNYLFCGYLNIPFIYYLNPDLKALENKDYVLQFLPFKVLGLK